MSPKLSGTVVCAAALAIVLHVGSVGSDGARTLEPPELWAKYGGAIQYACDGLAECSGTDVCNDAFTQTPCAQREENIEVSVPNTDVCVYTGDDNDSCTTSTNKDVCHVRWFCKVDPQDAENCIRDENPNLPPFGPPDNPHQVKVPESCGPDP